MISDFTNVASLNDDSDYLWVNLLPCWLVNRGKLLDIVMRQGFVCFAFQKTDEYAKDKNQEVVPTKTYKLVWQAILKHNFGNPSSKDHALTCTVYAHDTSSIVNLGIHLKYHELFLIMWQPMQNILLGTMILKSTRKIVECKLLSIQKVMMIQLVSYLKKFHDSFYF